MTTPLARDLEATLGPGVLSERLQTTASSFLDRYSKERLDLSPELLAGVARVVASSAAAASFLAHRSSLFERLRSLDAGYLERRSRELEREAMVAPGEDLEAFLDEIRLLRREETVLAACLDLSGSVPFEAVSAFLSRLAEAIVCRTLRVAAERLAGAAAPLSVVAMGKLAGREFTYHSDLDLIFLVVGADEVESASRVAQRLVGYLTTMTGAGVAYSVDTRLRPSGHQGMLVTSFGGYQRYQLDDAQVWEHLAILRSRAIAGRVERAQQLLDRVRTSLLSRRIRPWSYVSDLRRRIELERAQENERRVAFKTGAGGIMDVEFLAAGGLLERGPDHVGPVEANIPAMLRSVTAGPRVEELLAHYGFLRRVEARVRWSSDRAAEELVPDSEAFSVAAELLAPGGSPESVLAEIARVRRAVRAAMDRVREGDTIAALEA